MDATTPDPASTAGPSTTKRGPAKKAKDGSYTPRKELSKLLRLASFMSETDGIRLSENQIIEQAVIKHLLDLKKKGKLIPTKQIDELDSMLTESE